jgi:hypothetical protein
MEKGLDLKPIWFYVKAITESQKKHEQMIPA